MRSLQSPLFCDPVNGFLSCFQDSRLSFHNVREVSAWLGTPNPSICLQDVFGKEFAEAAFVSLVLQNSECWSQVIPWVKLPKLFRVVQFYMNSLFLDSYRSKCNALKMFGQPISQQLKQLQQLFDATAFSEFRNGSRGISQLWGRQMDATEGCKRNE